MRGFRSAGSAICILIFIATSAHSAVVFDAWTGGARALGVSNDGPIPATASQSDVNGVFLDGTRSASTTTDAQRTEDGNGVKSFSGTGVAQASCNSYRAPPPSTKYGCGASSASSSVYIQFRVTDVPVDVVLDWIYSGTPSGSCAPASCGSSSTLQLTTFTSGTVTLLRETSNSGAGSLDAYAMTLVPGSYALRFETTAAASTLSLLDAPTSLSGTANTSFDMAFGPPPQPVVFVPGVAGSVLIDRLADDDVLWVGSNPYRWLELSLYPSSSPGQHDVRPLEPLRNVVTKQFYGPFLDRLEAEGYVPYALVDSAGHVVSSRLTSLGCDLAQETDASKPTLFPFPYDWRLDNASNSTRLRDYIGCVQQFHPNTKIDVVAHSMGSLLARRYTLDYAGDHGLDKLITIGAPYLGAPKLLSVLGTGDFLDISLLADFFKQIVGSFSGAHQLLPSSDYFDLTHDFAPDLITDVVTEYDRDLNGDGQFGALDYDQMITFVNTTYGREGFLPGSTADAFHQGGQDDWSSDITGIAFHHILGRQSSPRTIGGVVATWKTSCNVFGGNCKMIPVLKPALVDGDGTVPVVSALRQGSTVDLNGPGAQIRVFTAQAPAEDDFFDHNGLMSQVLVQDQVLAWLATPTAQPQPQLQGVEAAAGSGPVYHQITLSGVSSFVVEDDLGNDTRLIGGVIQGQIPGVSTYLLGEDVWMALVPEAATGTHTLLFETTETPIGIEILTGDSDIPVRAIRYADLVMPAGLSGRLVLAPLGPGTLEIDSDRDAIFDTTILPAVDLMGAAAQDVRGPEIVVTPLAPSAPGMASISLSATDANEGTTTLYYSLNGSDYVPYTDPIELDPNVTPFVYALTQDSILNRSARAIDLRIVPEPDVRTTIFVAIAGLMALGRRRAARESEAAAS